MRQRLDRHSAAPAAIAVAGRAAPTVADNAPLVPLLLTMVRPCGWLPHVFYCSESTAVCVCLFLCPLRATLYSPVHASGCLSATAVNGLGLSKMAYIMPLHALCETACTIGFVRGAALLAIHSLHSACGDNADNQSRLAKSIPGLSLATHLHLCEPVCSSACERSADMSRGKERAQTGR